MQLRGARANGGRWLSLGAIVFGCAVGCHRASSERVTARFGVFFGGQLQEREELPLIVDRARLPIGVRLHWSEAPTSPEHVHWELEQPVSAKDADAGRLVAFGDARARPGESDLDVPLSFRPNDHTGAWRVRVSVEGRLVHERAFRVVPPGDAKRVTR